MLLVSINVLEVEQYSNMIAALDSEMTFFALHMEKNVIIVFDSLISKL